MSAAEIIRDLPQLTPADRQAVLEKLRELAAQEEPAAGHAVDLRACGIEETQAADLRARLTTFAEDWSRPEASIYDVTEAMAKMQFLSEERAARVVALIEDLAELEARENAEDLAAAREALADYEKTGESIPWETLKAELDAIHRHG